MVGLEEKKIKPVFFCVVLLGFGFLGYYHPNARLILLLRQCAKKLKGRNTKKRGKKKEEKKTW